MTERIKLASSNAGLGWWLGIDATKKDPSTYTAKAIILNVGVTQDDAKIVVRAEFATPFDFPESLVTAALELKSVGVDSTEQALLDDLRRRLAMQEIAWSQSASNKTFLKLPFGLNAEADGTFHGDARVLAGNVGTGDAAIAEFSARAALQLKVADKNGNEIDAQRAIAIVLVVYNDAIPKLRLDLDDFNFGFPEIDFPEIDLSALRKLKLPNLSGVSKTLKRLAAAIDVPVVVDITAKPGTTEPTLRIGPSGGALVWSLAATSADGAPPAEFDVTMKLGGTTFAEIQGLKAEWNGASGKLGGVVKIGQPTPFPNGLRRFGPLVARWNGVELHPAADAPLADLHQITLRGLLHFERLMIYAADDPSAVIAVGGDVEITPSGVRILKLNLVEPYPIELIVATGETVERAVASVWRFISALKPPSAPAPNDFIEGLRKLLDVLGRIAVAVGRAAVFVAQTAAGASELVAQALHGIADAIGKLMSALAELVVDAAKAARRYLVVEVRIASDSFEIRQVLVTMRRSAAVADFDRISALGFDIEIPMGWEPGLLMDFVARPGAYIIATRPEGLAAPFATLSTDLWLKHKDEPAQPMRDASGDSGDRGQSTQGGKPLFSVAAKVTGPGEFVIILAGLHQGKAVFFQKIKNVERRGVGGASGFSLVSSNGAFAFVEIDEDTFEFDVEFEKDRVLPLLGMGEPGKEAPANGAGGGFLDKLRGSLSQTVWVKSFDKAVPAGKLAANAVLVLGVKAAGVETEAKLTLQIDLSTFQVKIDASAGPLSLKSKRIEERALGLLWVVEQNDPAKKAANKEVEMFKLSFENGETSLRLNDDHENGAHMEVRFTDLSSDGRGVVLKVDAFSISRAGLDLTAKATGEPVRLNGLDVPFRFTTGELVIRGSRISRATIGGRGSLPRDLVGEVDCAVLLDFQQNPASNDIVLQSGKVEFGMKGQPIVCHSTRFTLTINDLDIAFARDGGYHFYFLVTGALEFTPRDSEFESGLLQFLKDVRIDLERTPLTSDPRVLMRHISFQKSLNPKKSFSLFHLFQFELRGFGFHPASPKFGGDPAMNISGQIKFAQIGDVMQPSIDFHGLWIAPPQKGKSLPRVKADGLGLDIGLSGVAKLRGSVLAVDPQTPSLEGMEFAPKGYDAYGFLGEGQLSIEGWGTMSASMGFMEVARKETPDERKKSFFLFLEMNKLAIEIPVVIWTFYLREVGFGFGYRYTLRGIKDAESATSVAKLVKTLDEVSKRQGDLSRFSSWLPDPDGDNVTLAMRGAFQSYPANKTYDEEAEKTAEEPFFFDIVAALRSDMTFLMAVRGWVATNYSDFLNDTTGAIRNHPGMRGYLYISAPRMELLARCIGDSTGYVGDRLGDIDTLKKALKSVDWSMTLYINPRLFHLELGWPNQLVARLRDDSNFRVVVRGGMIFRVAEDGILWGYNIEADAFIAFSGGMGGGSIGVAIEASLAVKFVARLIAFLSFQVSGTLIYGLISLDVNLSFSVRAWMKVDLGLTSFTINISFSFHVQFSAAVELAISTDGVGARVVAPIAVPAFGCVLWVTVRFTIGGSKLEEARARVQRFMALGITNESTPDPVKSVANAIGDNQVDKAAEQAESAAAAPVTPLPDQGNKPKPPIRRSALGEAIETTDFWLVTYAPAGDANAYAILVPKEPIDATRGAFYASPSVKPGVNRGDRSETLPTHTLTYGLDLSGVERWETTINDWRKMPAGSDPVPARWNRPIAATGDDGQPLKAEFTLAHLFDECFLYDADWNKDGEKPYRDTIAWNEPPPLRHGAVEELSGVDDDARKLTRDNAQRDHAAKAAENPLVDNVYQARSTVLSMFLDQFVTLAQDGGKRADTKTAHVTDLGLVFRGPIAEIEKLACIKVQKADPSNLGTVVLFNPKEMWFSARDPILRKTKPPLVDSGGVKIDWRLEIFGEHEEPTKEHRSSRDPEHFLLYYEITAEIDDRPRWNAPKRIKPAATLGGEKDAAREVFHPEWQFVDDLSDLPAALRQALLPASGEENALAASAAWASSFGDRLEVSLTYSVVPFDIAGTAGSKRSFIVEAPRPQSPIRPAEAELRFFVKHPYRPKYDTKHPGNLGIVLALRDPAWDDSKSKLGNGLRAKRSYRLIVQPEEVAPSGNYGSDGLTDRLKAPQSGPGASNAREASFWFDRDKLEDSAYEDATVRYEIEPDDDARRRFDDFLCLAGVPIASSSKAALLPPQDPKHNDQSTLFDVLWGRDAVDLTKPRRAASRFFLETLVSVVDEKNNKLHKDPFVSRRVPVDFEIRMDNAAPAKAGGPRPEPVLLRPDAFEWPVRLDMPPLGIGQVRASAGFAMFRAPRPNATLDEVVSGGGVSPIRDPDRRLLTTVEWDAMPDWAIAAEIDGDAAGAPLVDTSGLPDPLHAATLGGFDLHELDIDDLSTIDTGTRTVKDKGFSTDTQVWRRARRVARVQLLPRSSAQLTPHGNDDLLGWHAHYPSDTWRILNRQGAWGDSKPVKRGWWSAREATPRFPNRLVRHRLLPVADEAISSGLMAFGRPQRIYARLEMVPKSRAEATINEAERKSGNSVRAIALADVGVPGKQSSLNIFRASDAVGRWAGWTEISLWVDRFWTDRGHADELRPETIRRDFNVADLRALQICLAWNPGKAVRDAYAADPTALDGMILKLCAERDNVRKEYSLKNGSQDDANEVTLIKEPPDVKPVSTGATEAPLAFGGTIHAVLEETLAELELADRPGADPRSVYRRYKPVVQAAPPVDAKDVAGFFASTAPAKDPYGWGVLQALGLSVTIRLFDGDMDAFVEPQDLIARVNDVMPRVIDRYRRLLDENELRDSLGAPFAEILLRPGKDRVAAPFDAKIKIENRGLERDDALSLIQLSLRPRATSVWRYYRLLGFWKKPLGPAVTGHDGAVTSDANAVFLLAPDLNQTVDIFRPADGNRIEVKPALPETQDVDGVKNKKPTLATIGQPSPKKWLEDSEQVADPTLTLVLRARTDFEDDKLLPTVGLGVIKRTRKADTGNGAVLTDCDELSEEDIDSWIAHSKDDGGFSITHIACPDRFDGAQSVDPFERFEPKNPEEWSEALLGGAKTKVVNDAFESLRRIVQAAQPQMKWPAAVGEAEPPAELKSVIAVYLDWARRFLDYGAQPSDPEHYEPMLHVAFAAPSKATPWRLAAASNGALSISFLHADRWGHARAYAVKPFGRYQELMVSANAYSDDINQDRGDAREQLEQLIVGDRPLRPLGYGVAISPRTERVEAPVILGSKIMAIARTEKDKDKPVDPHNGEWQVVVPRHNEENLAYSNRPLFGRLGWEGVALSFVRDYREPDWPARLSSAMVDGDRPPTVEMHPTKEPTGVWPPSLSDAPPAFVDSDLGNLAEEFPSLWKGADVYRIARLPHFYRVTVLATARAGIVVSPLSVNVQDDFHAQMISDAGFAGVVGDGQGSKGQTVITIQPGTSRSVLQITLPLLSHADLMDPATKRTWVDDVAPMNNVAWWPDHDVVYVFQRQVENGGDRLLEDEAELRLVARNPTEATNSTGAKPLVVRARGPRFKPTTDDPRVEYSGNGSAPRFSAILELALASKVSPLASLKMGTSPDLETIKDFNNDADTRPFAVIASGHELTINLNTQPSDKIEDTINRIEELASTLVAAAADARDPDPGRAKLVLGTIGRTALAWAKEYERKQPPPELKSAEAVDQAGLANRKFTLAWPPGREFPLKVKTKATENCEFAPIEPSERILTLIDFPDRILSVDREIQPSLDRLIALARRTPIARKQLPALVTSADIIAFNTQTRPCTSRFAQIFARHALTLDMLPLTATEPVADYVRSLGLLADALKVAAQLALAAAPAADPASVAEFLEGRGREIRLWVDNFPTMGSPPATAAAAQAAAGLPVKFPLLWPTGIEFELSGARADCTVGVDADPESYLALFDIPTCEEMSDLATAAEIFDLLKRLARDLVAGGAERLNVRAVHPRAGEAGRVGVALAAVDWPAYFNAQSDGGPT